MPSKVTPPLHKREWGVGLRWRDVEQRNGKEKVSSEYFELDSPLNQLRAGGDGPRPWAEEPRYAWIVRDGELHIAGWVWVTPDDYEPYWEAMDLHVPWRNVIQLQVFRNNDWEGKPADPEDGEQA